MSGRWQRRRDPVHDAKTSESLAASLADAAGVCSGPNQYIDSSCNSSIGGVHQDPKTGEFMEGPGIVCWPVSAGRFDGSEGRHTDPWNSGEIQDVQKSPWKRSGLKVRQGQGIEEALSIIGAQAGSRQDLHGKNGYCPAGEPEYRIHEKALVSGEELQRNLEDLPLSDLHSLHAKKLDALKTQGQSVPDAHPEVRAGATLRNIRRARRRAEQRGEYTSSISTPPTRTSGGCVVLVRDDCRLHDNPALYHASVSHPWVVPLYVHDDADPSPLPVRGAALYWRHMSLASYQQALSRCKARLIIRRGRYIEEVLDVLLASQAQALYFNRQLEPWYHERDVELEQQITAMGFEVRSFKGMVLQQEPWEHMEPRPPARLLTKYQGDPNQSEDAAPSPALEAPEPPEPTVKEIRVSAPKVFTLALSELGYGLSAGKGMPATMIQYNSFREMEIKRGAIERGSENDWAFELRRFWSFGETGGLAQLERFLVEAAAGHYQPPERYRADKAWTALLSPYLRFGDLSSRYVYARAREVLSFLHWKPLVRRLFWRDGAYAQLYRWPMSHRLSIRQQYEAQTWNGTPEMLRSWQRGESGYPLIDAAMRQLWKVGWMPNYLRHVTAQFLVEYLDINWKQGLLWFDYTLVDSDVAINSMMWQMGGHSGLGAWNFVMHPVFAAKKVDPEGDYVRRWLPELGQLPVEYIHCPWEAPCACLLSANVLLSQSYAERVIHDLVMARKAHARNVIAVRQACPEKLREDGHEILEVGGEKITVRVRDDLKDNSLNISLLMTPDEARSMQRRRLLSKGVHHTLLFEDIKKYECFHAQEFGGTL